jgi:hypothetical protein
MKMNENLAKIVDLELNSLVQLLDDIMREYTNKEARPPFWKFIISDSWEEIQEFIYKAWINPEKLSSLVTECWLLSSKGLHIRCKICVSVNLTADKTLPLSLFFAFLPIESSFSLFEF